MRNKEVLQSNIERQYLAKWVRKNDVEICIVNVAHECYNYFIGGCNNE